MYACADGARYAVDHEWTLPIHCLHVNDVSHFSARMSILAADYRILVDETTLMWMLKRIEKQPMHYAKIIW